MLSVVIIIAVPAVLAMCCWLCYEEGKGASREEAAWAYAEGREDEREAQGDNHFCELCGCTRCIEREAALKHD